MNCILILFVLEILMFFIAFTVTGKDIMAPSVMMCIMFIISTFFAILNADNWYVDFSAEACLILSTGIFVFFIGETCFRYLLQKKKDVNHIHQCIGNDIFFRVIPVQNGMIALLILINLITIAWYFLEIRRIVSGYGASTENLFASYRQIYSRLAVVSDSEVEMVNKILSQFVKVSQASGFISIYIIINNFLVKKQKLLHYLYKNLGLLMVVILSILPGLMLAGRNQLLQMIVAALIEYYILWHQKYGWNRNLSWKYIYIGLLCIAIGIPAFYYTLHFLGRRTDAAMFEYVSIYIGSSIVLFDQFLKSPVTPPRVFGEETFLGVHQLLYRLGVPTYVKNRHLEFRHLNMVRSSNIYTFFRRPLHDFGLFGMYIFTILVSILFCWIYYGKIKGQPKTKKTDYWVLVYGYLYYWIIYTSIDQRSISFVSVSAILVVLAILIGYTIVTRIKLVWRGR